MHFEGEVALYYFCMASISEAWATMETSIMPNLQLMLVSLGALSSSPVSASATGLSLRDASCSRIFFRLDSTSASRP
eukprot:2028532-Amphidinium_carterae.5